MPGMGIDSGIGALPNALSESTFWALYLPLTNLNSFGIHCARHWEQLEQGGMSSYISRVFARPHPTQESIPPRPINDREPELGHDQNHHNHNSPAPPAPTGNTQAPTSDPSSSIAQAIVNKPSEDQFQIMLSSILTQNSNLLAQNTEQARVIDRLSICLSEAEAGQKELREEMRGMFRGIMDILGGLKSTPAPSGGGGAGTPVSSGSDVVPSITQVRDEFRDLIIPDQDQGTGIGADTSPEGYWSREKGKQREDGQGVDPNEIQRRTFTPLDTPTNRGDNGQAMDMDVWNNNGDGGDVMLNAEIRPNRRQS
jgi:hypothetical protein